jgi:hypothetical protein
MPIRGLIVRKRVLVYNPAPREASPALHFALLAIEELSRTALPPRRALLGLPGPSTELGRRCAPTPARQECAEEAAYG